MHLPPSTDELVAHAFRVVADFGAVQTHHYDVLRGPVPQPHGAGDAIDITAVAPDRALLFARTLLAGHVDSFYDHEAEGLATLAGAPGITCYMATVDGEPAAAAMLSVEGDVAYLANASTLGPRRGLGCHSALLRARLRDAARAGCTVVLGGAAGGSTSHRNMERAGLHTLRSFDTWTFPPDR